MDVLVRDGKHKVNVGDRVRVAAADLSSFKVTVHDSGFVGRLDRLTVGRDGRVTAVVLASSGRYSGKVRMVTADRVTRMRTGRAVTS